MNLIKTLESLGATTAQRMLVLLELYERGPIATNDFQSAATGFTREMLMVFEAGETVESTLVTGKRKDGRIWRLTDKAVSAIAGALGANVANHKSSEATQALDSPLTEMEIRGNWMWLYGLDVIWREDELTVVRASNAHVVVHVAVDPSQSKIEKMRKACQEVAQICGIAPPILTP